MADNAKIEAVSDLLLYIKTVLEGHGVFFWLDAGTLLKTIRDLNIVPSSDIDLGTWQDQVDNVIAACREFRKDGFKVKYQGGISYVEDSIKVQIPGEYKGIITELSFDIYLYTKMGDEVVRRNFNRPTGAFGKFFLRMFYEFNANEEGEPASMKYRFFLKTRDLLPVKIRDILNNFILDCYNRFCYTLWFVFPASCFETFSRVQLYGLDFNIPQHVDSYFKSRYGENWKTPSRKYRLTDGNFLRIRRLSHMPEKDRVYRKVRSDVFPAIKNSKKTGLFHFSKQEINNIKKTGV